MNMGKHKVKDKIAYFVPGLVVLSIFQAVVIVQPAMGQCIEPAQKQECSPPQTIETIFNDNSQHIYINDLEVALLNCIFHPAPLFNIDTKLEDDLNRGIVSDNLKIVFKTNGYSLSDDAFINSKVKKIEWVLSGKILVGNEPIFPARVYIYRLGTDELVRSCGTTATDGSYSLKLPDGEYDVNVETWNEFSNPQYDTKTIVINNSNVSLDFKASRFFYTILPNVLAFIRLLHKAYRKVK